MYRSLRMLCLIVSTGCAAKGGAVPYPFPVPDAPPPSAVSAVASRPADINEIVGTAFNLLGSPYRPGGKTPDGFDCSGFTQYVFAQHGITLPRLTVDQYRTGTPIEQDSLQAGDLVFFTTVDPGASHVGVSTGDGRFIHAPTERGRVRVEHLESTYWSQRYIGARKVID